MYNIIILLRILFYTLFPVFLSPTASFAISTIRKYYEILLLYCIGLFLVYHLNLNYIKEIKTKKSP
jgi:hypothetical protein